jgi:hypothetical protein
MIGNVLAGYRLAAGHLRQLLAVLLPVTAVALLGLAVLDVVFGRDRTVIINWFPVVAGDQALARARVAVIVGCWLLLGARAGGGRVDGGAAGSGVACAAAGRLGLAADPRACCGDGRCGAARWDRRAPPSAGGPSSG